MCGILFTNDPDIDNNLNLTLNKAQKRTVNYALTNTFGFGGHNASILFKISIILLETAVLLIKNRK